MAAKRCNHRPWTYNWTYDCTAARLLVQQLAFSVTAARVTSIADTRTRHRQMRGACLARPRTSVSIYVLDCTVIACTVVQAPAILPIANRTGDLVLL